MTAEDALLAAVLADQADNTARLVYADALDEAGDHGRAWLIRGQCDGSLPENPPLAVEPGGIVHFECHDPGGPGRFRVDVFDLPVWAPGPVVVTVRRGFVERVAADYPALPDDVLRAVFARHPVTAVRAADRSPWCTAYREGFWGWWAESPSITAAERDAVRPSLADRMSRDPRRKPTGLSTEYPSQRYRDLSLCGGHVLFASPRDALDALSDAYVGLGRELAGVPQPPVTR